MATRAFLLCGDEKAVHAVTQILDELEVSFEHSSEPAFSLKRLSVQKFDLLLVDCDNAQNATQVFNSARASNLNKNSIAIAIVEGKAGVPNAFRLGASLVLTKPVSLEQVRNTLRTGIGMTRKDGPETKTPAAPFVPATSAVPAAPGTVSAPSAAIAPAIPVRPVAAAPVPPPTPAIASEPKISAPVAAPKPPAVVPRPVAISMAPAPESKPAAPATEAKSPSAPAAQLLVKAAAASAAPAPAKSNFDSIFAATATTDDTKLKPGDAKSVEEEEVKQALESSLKISGPKADPKAEPKAESENQNDLDSDDDFGAPSFGGMAKQPFAGEDEPVKKGGRGALIAALVLVVLGGASYAAWATQPAIRNFVAWEFLNVSSKIAAIRGEAPASTPARPVAQAPVPVAPVAPAPAADPASTDANATPAAASNAPAMTPATNATGSPNAQPATPAPDGTPQKVPSIQPAKQDTTTNHAGPSAALVPASANIPPTPATKSTGSDLLEVPEDFADDQIVHRVHPAYPKQARLRKLHGTVVLEAVVNKQGKVDSLQLVSGDPVLAQAAADAVKQWRYKPYLHNGDYTDFQTRVTVEFKEPELLKTAR